MARPRKPRLTLRQTVESNRLALTFMAKLAGNEPPTFHEDLLKPKRERKAAAPKVHPSEAEVLKTILKYLRYHPKVGLVIRVNSGVFAENDRFISANSQRGMSDICGCLKTGQAFFIEVKSHSGKLMAHQDEFLLKALESNALAGVARDISDVDKILGFS
jgi:hypothetical protein